MSDAYGGKLRMFGHKKAGTSTFSNSSLISPHTPTLANPTRGFGLPTNNVIQAATKESSNSQQAQPAGEQSLLSEAIEQQSFSHNISRIALRRPQAKLTVGEPGDKYEQEADWMANQVMRMVIPEKINASSVKPVQDSLQRKCAACEQEENKAQTKPSIQMFTDGGFEAGDNVESRLNSSKGGGSPLSDEVRGFMEPRFGSDFSQVRVHTGSDAVQMNRDLSAQAFTHQQDIYFGSGKSPGKDALTAHELTHVVQQNGAVQMKNEHTLQSKYTTSEKENESEFQPSLDAWNSPVPEYLQSAVTQGESATSGYRQELSLFRQQNDNHVLARYQERLGEATGDSITQGSPLQHIQRSACGGDNELPFCFITRQANYKTVAAENREDAIAKVARNIIYGGSAASLCHDGACVNEGQSVTEVDEGCQS